MISEDGPLERILGEVFRHTAEVVERSCAAGPRKDQVVAHPLHKEGGPGRVASRLAEDEVPDGEDFARGVVEGLDDELHGAGAAGNEVIQFQGETSRGGGEFCATEDAVWQDRIVRSDEIDGIIDVAVDDERGKESINVLGAAGGVIDLKHSAEQHLAGGREINQLTGELPRATAGIVHHDGALKAIDDPAGGIGTGEGVDRDRGSGAEIGGNDLGRAHGCRSVAQWVVGILDGEVE